MTVPPRTGRRELGGELSGWDLRANRPHHKNMEMVAIAKKIEQTLIDEQLEKGQKIWRWLIVAAILLVLLETWLGGWMWRRPAAGGASEGVA